MAQRTSFTLDKDDIINLQDLAEAIGCLDTRRVTKTPNMTALIKLIARNASNPRLIDLLEDLNRNKT